MREVLVSIIIPVYNCEQYLSQCIDSILSQTYHCLEIILVDDGSMDASGIICDDHACKDPRVVVIHQENSGVAAARKAGIERASGRYMMFVDADDWCDPDYVESLLDQMLKEKTDAVIGLMRTCWQSGKIDEACHYFPCGYYDKQRLQKIIYPEMLSATPYYTFGIAPSMWGKLFDSEIAKHNTKALETGITIGEDGCFTYSVLLDCDSIYIANISGYNYRVCMSSITHRFDNKLWREGELLRTFFKHLVREKQWDAELQIDEYMAFMCNRMVTRASITGNVDSKQGRAALKAYIKDTLPDNILRNHKIRKSSLKIRIKLLLIKLRAVRMLSIITKTRIHE